MGEYARKECASCHIILPANEMFQRSSTVVSGRSESTSQRMGSRPGESAYPIPRHTSTTHYRAESYWLCSQCEQRRRKQKRRLILVGVVGTAAVLGWSVVRSPAPRPASIPHQAKAEIADSAAAAEDDASETSAPASEASASSGEDESPNSDADTLLPQLQTMLAGDIRKALANNETRLWHMNGMRGYVVLSGNSVAASNCRNVIVTLIDDENQRQSPPQQWCRSADEGEWHPA